MCFGVRTSATSFAALASTSALIFSVTFGFSLFDGAQVYCRPDFFFDIVKTPAKTDDLPHFQHPCNSWFSVFGGSCQHLQIGQNLNLTAAMGVAAKHQQVGLHILLHHQLENIPDNLAGEIRKEIIV